MCYGTLQYSCCHTQTTRLTCRKTWRKRTGWLCYAIVTFICGVGPDEPCDEVRGDKHWWVTRSCPDCRAAEEAGTQTKGRVHDRYASKLTPEDLRRSRRRKEEEDRQKDLERKAYRDDRIEMQKIKRADQGYDRNAPLPAMPSFAHVSLGDRSGQPLHRLPQQGANKSPSASSQQKSPLNIPHDEQQDANTNGYTRSRKMQAISNDKPVDVDHRSKRERRVGGYGGFDLSPYGHDQMRRNTLKVHDDGRNPYRPYEKDMSPRNLTPPKSTPEAASPSSTGQRQRFTDRRDQNLKPLRMLQLPGSLAGQTPVNQTPKYSGERNGGVERLLDSATRASVRTESMVSDSDSFVCQDARAVERGR
ncbi:uncharacterized protein CTRU02_205460 [Colletotrichum truncatum]|uniref:Uncharacterized protein n=1 Tax=Colletotrichum truncatum TaxID=5467 RepID=A0ACC3Z4E3_COLTU|nr:uncharacterized protein CTRU02_04516 [Colletotrichum truncatum]KAF6795706.1 hypothetical protein CTRU02_04516 [Colletotrichum truncatum]